MLFPATLHHSDTRYDSVTFKVAQKTGKRVPSPIYLDDDATTKLSDLVHVRKRGRQRIVFGWYGGKFSHLE